MYFLRRPNIVTLCECHGEIKGYLLTIYLLYTANYGIRMSGLTYQPNKATDYMYIV